MIVLFLIRGREFFELLNNTYNLKNDFLLCAVSFQVVLYSTH